MKNSILKPAAFLFSLAAFVSCKKNTTTTQPPSPNNPTSSYVYSSDLQSSKDISMATYAITDIEMICAYLGERNFAPAFYLSISPSSQTSTHTIVFDEQAREYVAGYNSTSCLDGKTRTGSLFFYNVPNSATSTNPFQVLRPYLDYGFSTDVFLANYEVDGWKIQLFDSSQLARVTNKITSPLYNPSQVNLSWEISGKFKMSNSQFPNRQIVWEGTLLKTLVNTSDSNVFKPAKTSPINWNKAVVKYSGTVTGTCNGNFPFTYTIDNSNLLTRDFNCFVTPANSAGATEYHPFVNGSATLNFSNYDPRTINYGPSSSCDNSGTISFAQESHTVNFD